MCLCFSILVLLFYDRDPLYDPPKVSQMSIRYSHSVDKSVIVMCNAL